ncbi:metallophosphoesterase 1 homolog [Pectinophora gossypiella]|uniref:metallophosphoesterase 1 homolog n=1 Tax=Pectinophora gossypiella TaxID=13191 RepID=UPI00214E53FD|nr:metallophosphoesterase 1 homolog [Pectinophora gossypiella]
MRRVTKRLSFLFCGIIFIVFYCEFLIYYVVIAQCYWPPLTVSKSGADVLKVFMLTDIHLLGPRGNKFDKMRREWQMHRAFQTILTVHQPDVVFILGDIFDAGQRVNENQFNNYVDSFHGKFSVPNHIRMYIVAGNHDIGFHNEMSPKRVHQFYEKLNSKSVRFVTLKNNHFVFINSMTMEGDNCAFCKRARERIEEISEELNCSRSPTQCENVNKTEIIYSQPILIQHFPMSRISDAVCTEPDSVPWYEKDIPFTPKIEALSREATDYLAMKIRPRTVFGGHTHYGCTQRHVYDNDTIDFLEYTIPSFNWRNIFTPKYMLVSVTPGEYAINKCGLPGEHTIVISAVIILLVTLYVVRKRV